jgi:hypothetical protein
MERWIDRLSPDEKTDFLSNLKKISDESLSWLERARRVERDRTFRSTVGGEAIDLYAKGSALEAYSIAINRGESPVRALEKAKEQARFVYENHSRKRELFLHRSPDTLNSFLSDRLRWGIPR